MFPGNPWTAREDAWGNQSGNPDTLNYYRAILIQFCCDQNLYRLLKCSQETQNKEKHRITQQFHCVFTIGRRLDKRVVENRLITCLRQNNILLPVLGNAQMKFSVFLFLFFFFILLSQTYIAAADGTLSIKLHLNTNIIKFFGAF